MKCPKCGLALIEECTEVRPSDAVEVIRYRCLSSGDKHSYQIERRIPSFPKPRVYKPKKYRTVKEAWLDGEGK